MKRCIFTGPSLHGISERPPGIVFLPPAGQGDLIRAVHDDFDCIGLIDGYFGSCASVWHKEILYALSTGCLVLGAASMGALRAAECQRYGMRPVGIIAGQYATGLLTDDADVALVHAPQEADYLPLTEPLVDVRATIGAMQAAGSISAGEAGMLVAAARSTYFGDRTVEAMVARASLEPTRHLEVVALYEVHRVRLKQADALQLVSEIGAADASVKAGSSGWKLAQSASLSCLNAPGGYATASISAS